MRENGNGTAMAVVPRNGSVPKLKDINGTPDFVPSAYLRAMLEEAEASVKKRGSPQAG